MFQATSQGHRFQSTPPARGATTPTSGNDWSRIFQSTPPARGATCWRRGCGAIRPMISIHAPREGGDCSAAATRCSHVYFNPRPPRGGRRVVRAQLGVADEFQSTPPARGATAVFLNWVIFLSISIHATREGGDVWVHPEGRFAVVISIHAPREGGDASRLAELRGLLISIHAPREGGDVVVAVLDAALGDFNPRPPRGGRLNGMPVGSAWFLFQSTPPARGATGISAGRFSPMPFQSTPPARGATTDALHHLVQNGNFNPRPPRGGRQQRCTVLSVDL